MRCSSCEPLLDRYVEGTLSPRAMIDVSAHLRQCASCRDLLEELKAVDGLLATTRVAELPENFTFAVMAEARSMPAPRPRAHPVWSFIVLYSAAAWVAAVLGVISSGAHPANLFHAVSSALARTGALSATVSANLSHGLSHVTPGMAALGAGVLAVDFALAAAFALLYFVVRPRVAARLASVAESSS